MERVYHKIIRSNRFISVKIKTVYKGNESGLPEYINGLHIESKRFTQRGNENENSLQTVYSFHKNETVYRVGMKADYQDQSI